eukprot:194621_1
MSYKYARVSSMNFQELFLNKLYLFDPEQLNTLRFHPDELQKRDILVSGYLREEGNGKIYFPVVIVHLVLIRLPKFKPVDEVKLTMGGSLSAGKTSLIKQITSQTHRFTLAERPTMLSDFHSSRYYNKLTTTEIRLTVHDLSGNPRYKKASKVHFRYADIAIIVYDITSQESLEYGVDLIKNHVDKRSMCVLVGNKLDLKSDREVDKEDAVAIADEHKCHYFETSAKEYEEVESLFQNIINKMMYTFPADETFVR